jgi:integrase
MSGHIRRRGARSWELKFDLGTDPLTGKRITRYHSLKGTRREAEAELVRLMASADRGDYVGISRLTLSAFLDRWEAWAATQVSAKTLERYRELANLHVRPHLGNAQMQKLRTLHFAELYGRLQRAKPVGAGLAPRTITHIHRLLHRQFGHAVKWGVIGASPVAMAEPPRVQASEITILEPEQIRTMLTALRGRQLYVVAVLAISTGLRRGELVALRWRDIDLETGQIRVERSLEQTNAGLAFKSPKTRASRRTVTIPRAIAAELQKHWRTQQERRLALGLGRSGPDDLVFARADAAPWPPDSLTTAWQKAIASLRLPQVTLHGLRHTHVSQLIAAGLDVVTVSRRIGHSNPTVTLNVYAHLFGNTDQRAAAVVETALAAILAD